MMRPLTRWIPALILLACAGCGDGGEDIPPAPETAPPVAVALAGESATLADLLARLEQTVEAAIEGGLEGEGRRRMLQAEALSDRLLATDLPFEWIAVGPDGYFLAARLRQIQAQADRIIAEMRRGLMDVALEDAEALRQQVEALRTALARGEGGEAPPPLDSLLAADTTDLLPPLPGEAGGAEPADTAAAEEEPAEEGGDDGLLGEPVEGGT